MPAAGLIAAFIALISWGIGDFSIQRAVRGVGSTTALFAIAAFGTVALLPFAWQSIPAIIASSQIVGVIALVALLGVLWNKEKLQRHQYAGMVLAIAAAVVLAAVSG